jgi:hypothetical protein
VRVVIGVVGHRDVDAAAIRPRVARVLDELRLRICPHDPARVAFTALSPLAEGTDRIVAEAVLAAGPDSRLDVVLPLDRAEYVATFSAGSGPPLADFDRLVQGARRVVRMSPKQGLHEALAAAGRYVVDRSDVLITVHDPGRPSHPGGTGETVAYARRQGRSIVELDPTRDGVALPAVGEVEPDVLERLRRFWHRPRPWDDAFADGSTRDLELQLAEAAELVPEAVAEVREHLVPAYHRANVVAVASKRRYATAANAGYACAALAVTVAAGERLLPADVARFAPLVEVLLLAAVVGIVLLARAARWHATWLDHRFLAEQFRSAIYLALAGREVARLRPHGMRPGRRRAAARDGSWLVHAHAAVVGSLARLRAPRAESIPAVAAALARLWPTAQLAFHEHAAARKRATHRTLSLAGLSLFGAALVAAVLRTLHLGHQPTLEFLCLSLPAVGAALAGMRSHGEYERSARRSAEVLEPLAEARDRLAHANTPEAFHRALLDVEATLRFEAEDWRVVHRFREVELPG